MVQDDELNYWFATDQGFYKYDGYDFIPVPCPGAKGQSAFGFVKNKNGVIFSYNLNNQILKIENSQCSVFYELKENEQASDLFFKITDDNLLAVITRTVLLFDEKGKKLPAQEMEPNYYGFPFQSGAGVTISHILGKDSLVVIDKGKIARVALRNPSDRINGVLKFFRIRSNAYAVDVSNKKYYEFNEFEFSVRPLQNRLAGTDKEFLRFYNENDYLWIAHSVSGVRLVRDPHEGSSELFFSKYLISDVYKDHEGNLLLSTFNYGVIVIPNLDIPDVLPLTGEHSIVSLCRDEELGLVMGTLKGQLLLLNGDKYTTLYEEGSRPLQSVFGWAEFPYILFDDGYIKALNKKTGKVTPFFFSSLKDAAVINGTSVYLALNTGACKLTVTGEDKFEKEFPEALRIRTYAIGIEPASHHVFIATSDGLKITYPDGVTRVIRDNGETIFANDIAIANGQVFVASKNMGILIFEKDKIVRRIHPVLNQKQVEIFKIIVAQDRIYANSSQGFTMLDSTGKILTRLNKAHGFSTNKIFDFEVMGDRLWIAHSKGVQRLNISQLFNDIPLPLIQIAGIRVNDTLLKEISVKENFSNEHSKFLFTLSSPTLRNKENIQYHYKLEGYGAVWHVNPYSDNSIIYNALQPGDYTFIVKAENQGVFSEPVSYSFFIERPFYLRGWFLSLTAVVFILIVGFTYRFQLNVQRKKARMINEINLSKLTAIQSQMNPHFIFNSLNSIQDLVLKGDVDNSYTFITKFANLIRRTLNYSDKDFIDFEQEIKLIELYLSLEKLRFKEEFNYAIHVGGIEDVMVPPMLIQPFIENSLVHGLLHKEGSREITISFQLTEILTCTIEDNGVGREKAKEIKLRQRSEHESFSSQAIRKRFSILSQHYKGRLGFEYEDLFQNNQPSGTRVTLSIPVKRRF